MCVGVGLGGGGEGTCMNACVCVGFISELGCIENQTIASSIR